MHVSRLRMGRWLDGWGLRKGSGRGLEVCGERAYVAKILK